MPTQLKENPTPVVLQHPYVRLLVQGKRESVSSFQSRISRCMRIPKGREYGMEPWEMGVMEDCGTKLFWILLRGDSIIDYIYEEEVVKGKEE